MNTDYTQSKQSQHISREDILKTVARLDELSANLKVVLSRMDERSMEAIDLDQAACTSSCIDGLIQFIAQAEQAIAKEPLKV